MFEEMEEGVVREIEEECGIKISLSDIKLWKFFNVVRKELNFHFVNFIFVCQYSSSKYQPISNKEPNKCYGWEWLALEKIYSLHSQLCHGIQDICTKFTAEQLRAEILACLQQLAQKK